MQMAIESWPLNPQIKEQNDLFASIADVQVTTLNELDTLLAQSNKREIMKNMVSLQSGQFKLKHFQQLQTINFYIISVTLLEVNHFHYLSSIVFLTI